MSAPQRAGPAGPDAGPSRTGLHRGPAVISNADVMDLVLMRLPTDAVASCALSCKTLHLFAQVRLSLSHLEAETEPSPMVSLASVKSLSAVVAPWGQDDALRHLTAVLPACTDLDVLRLRTPLFPERNVCKVLRTCMKLTRLTSVSITDTSMRGPAVRALATTIKQLPRLSLLDLSGNSLGDEGAKHTVRALSGTSFLTALLLNANNLTPALVPDLLASSVPSQNLRYLSLNHNRICSTTGSAGPLACLVKALPLVHHLHLASNADCHFQDFVGVFRALPHLQSLDLSVDSSRHPRGIPLCPQFARELTHLQGLTALSLRGHGGCRVRTREQQLHRTCIRMILQVLTQLRHLDIEVDTADLAETAASALLSLSQLSHLTLGSPGGAPAVHVDPSTWSFLQSCTQLQTFGLCGALERLPWHVLATWNHLTRLSLTLEFHPMWVLDSQTAAGLQRMLSAASQLLELSYTCVHKEGVFSDVAKGISCGGTVTRLQLAGRWWRTWGTEHRCAALLGTLVSLRHVDMNLQDDSGLRLPDALDALRHLSGLTCLSLGGEVELSAAACHCLMAALPSMQRLRELRVTARFSSKLARGLLCAALTDLRRLTLLRVDNTDVLRMVPCQVKSLGPKARSGGAAYDAEAARQFRAAVAAGSQGLDMSRALSRLRWLQVLQLRACDAHELCESLPNMCLLVSLDIRDTVFGSHEGWSFGHCIKAVPHLGSLVLDGCRFGDGGELPTAVIDGVEGLRGLTRLSMLGMGLKRPSVRRVRMVTKKLPELVVLELEDAVLSGGVAAKVVSRFAGVWGRLGRRRPVGFNMNRRRRAASMS